MSPITKHGGAKGEPSREYLAWGNAKSRCYNPLNHNYPRYGARGIVMYPEWRHDFACFLADMGLCPPGYSIERIDNDGPYAPWNCRWADATAQGRNTRKNHRLTFNGETLCLTDWATRIGLGKSTLRERLSKGWSVERALTEPVRKSVGGRYAKR